MFNKYPLLIRLVFLLFLFSVGATILVGMSIISYQYKRQVVQIQSNLDALQKSQVNILVRNVWTLNDQAIRIQLESIVELGLKGQFDFMFYRMTSAPTADPQYFLDAGFKTGGYGNDGQYSNAEFDALCDKLGNTFDKAERNKLGIEGTKILLEDNAAIFLFYG